MKIHCLYFQFGSLSLESSRLKKKKDKGNKELKAPFVPKRSIVSERDIETTKQRVKHRNKGAQRIMTNLHQQARFELSKFDGIIFLINALFAVIFIINHSSLLKNIL